MKNHIKDERLSKIEEDSGAVKIDLDVVGIDEDFDDGLEGSKVITKNQVFNTKPKKTEWFRVMGDSLQDIKKGVSVAMMAADDREHDFYVYPSTKQFVSRVKEDFKSYMAQAQAARDRVKKKQEERKKSDAQYADTKKHGVKFFDKKGSGRIVKGKKVYN